MDGKERVGLMCINIDVSYFRKANRLLDTFLNPDTLIELPDLLFKDDWQERINVFVNNWLKSNKRDMESLTRSEKKQLIEVLQKEGAFRGKR